jgi:hypothetical protein
MNPQPPATDYFLTLDLGHPPLPPAKVEAELTAALSQVRGSATLRAIKVVHGYGSHGRGGATKETVRNWAFQFRRRFRCVIAGESYNIFDADTQELRDECGQAADADLGAANPGITILWVK